MGVLHDRRGIAALLSMCVVVLGGLVTAPSAHASTQRVSYFMNGDCSDYHDETGEYAFFEVEPDWDCYLTVQVKPTKPVRTIKLQYWNGRKWIQESSAKTNSKGVGRLDFNPICADDNYCDGTWKYRVLVDAAAGQRFRTSMTFEVTFYPMDMSDEDDF